MGKTNTLFFLVFLLIFFAHCIFPDEQYCITSIKVKGNKRSKDFVILQECRFEEGKCYTLPELEERAGVTKQRLKNLGIFSEVDIEIETGDCEKPPCAATVVIQIKDRWTFFPLPLYYVDNKIGHIIGFNIQDFNVFGLGQSLHLKGLYNPYLKSLFLMWHYPRMFGSYFAADVEIGYRDYSDLVYKDDTLAYQADIRRFENSLRLRKRFPIGNTELAPFIGYEFALGETFIIKNEIDREEENEDYVILNAGLQHGLLNRDTGTVWGDQNEVMALYSVFDQMPGLQLQHAKYFRIFGRSTLAYSLQGQINPFREIQLTSLDVRGIKPGQLRGNYGIHMNIDLRLYVTSFHLIVDNDLYWVFFTDIGNYFSVDETVDILETPITAGIGIRLYLEQVGGPGKGGRFDFGINFKSVSEEKPIEYVIFVALAFDEMF